MANKLELPADPKLAAKIIDSESGHRSRLAEMGWIGRAMGGGIEKSGNLAGFIMVVSMLSLVAAAFIPGVPDRTPLIGIFGGLVTTSLGYIFGRGSYRSSDNN